MKFPSDLVADSNDKNHFLNKLLSTKLQVSRLCKAFANNSSANIKSLKSQLHKIGESGGFLGRMLGPLLKTGLHLIIITVIKAKGFITIRTNRSSIRTNADIQKVYF